MFSNGIRFLGASVQHVTMFDNLSRHMRRVAKENLQRYDVFFHSSCDTNWVDSMREKGSVWASKVCTDLMPIVFHKKEDGTFEQRPAIDVRLHDNVRFNPHVGSIPLKNIQMEIDGVWYPYTSREVAREIARQKLDAYCNTKKGEAHIRREITKEHDAVKYITKDEVTEYIYASMINNITDHVHFQLNHYANKGMKGAVYNKLFVQFGEGELCVGSKNYISGAREVQTSAGGKSTLSSMTRGAMWGAVKETLVEHSLPWKRVKRDTHALCFEATETEYSMAGLVAAKCAAAEDKKRKREKLKPKTKHAKVVETPIKNFKTMSTAVFVCMQWDNTLPERVLFKGGGAKGGSAATSSAPKMRGGAKAVSRPTLPVQQDSGPPVDRMATFSFKAMDVTLDGSKIEDTPISNREEELDDPATVGFLGFTVFCVNNAVISPKNAAGDTLDFESIFQRNENGDLVEGAETLIPDQYLKESLENALPLYKATNDVLAGTPGFLPLFESDQAVAREDMTEEDKQRVDRCAAVNQVADKIGSSVFGMSDDEVEAQVEEVKIQVNHSPPVQTTVVVPPPPTVVPLSSEDLKKVKAGEIAMKGNMIVTVREHDGKDDDEGEPWPTGTSENGTYTMTVNESMLIRVNVKNKGEAPISFVPVYIDEDGAEEVEDKIDLEAGGNCELPYPLQKEAGEGDDGWILRDTDGATLMRLNFSL